MQVTFTKTKAISGLSHDGDDAKALDAGATALLMKGGLYHEVADAIVDAAQQH
jgi:hypothetical protein